MLPSQRQLFDMPREVCYFNAAGWSPLPLATVEAARKAVARKAQPWLIDAEFQSAQYERTRRAAARLINASPADVALISSVAYGVATAAKVLRVPEGSRVLVLEDDHSSPVLEWMTRAEAEGFTVETVRRPGNGDWTEAVLEAIERTGAAPDRGRLDLVDPLVGRRQDRPRPRRPRAQGARRGAPRRCHARRRRHAARRRRARSRLRGVPDLQMAAWSLRSRLPLRGKAPPGRHTPGADELRPPLGARRAGRLLQGHRAPGRCPALRHGRARPLHLHGDGGDGHGAGRRLGDRCGPGASRDADGAARRRARAPRA